METPLEKSLDELSKSIDRVCEERNLLMLELFVQDWHRDAHVVGQSYTYCIYCGEEGPFGNPAAIKHSEECLRDSAQVLLRKVAS